MKEFKLTLENDIRMIHPVQAATGAYARLLGFAGSEQATVELILEEALSNVIQHEYLSGQSGSIDVSMEPHTLGLTLRILSLGLPPDLETIHRLEHQSTSEMIREGLKGLGVFLIRHLADEVVYLNKGRDGQEIRITKYLQQPKVVSEGLEEKRTDPPANPVKPEFYIRRMKGTEAATISKLAYTAYNLSYVYDQIYYPERVRQLNETDELISFVAVSKGDEDILGHSALIFDTYSSMVEMAVAFVNPAYRGSGCLNQLALHSMEYIRSIKSPGVFVHAVTVHPYSQKAAFSMGLRECALFVSRVTVLEMSKIEGSSHTRESLLLQVLPLGTFQRKEIFAPEHHKEMIRDIYTNLGIEVNTTDSITMPTVPSSGHLESKTDAYLAAHIFVHTYGADVVDEVKKTLKAFCLSRVETVYLYLPLDEAPTALHCADFEALGFFFGGIRPGHGTRDWLLLQYLNNQRYPYSLLKFCSPFGERLARYIAALDPSEPS